MYIHFIPKALSPTRNMCFASFVSGLDFTCISHILSLPFPVIDAYIFISCLSLRFASLFLSYVLPSYEDQYFSLESLLRTPLEK